jgi:hypothetical protein
MKDTRKSCNIISQKEFRNMCLITLASVWHFQHPILIATLQGFSVAHVKKHSYLSNKSPIMFKVILLSQR